MRGSDATTRSRKVARGFYFPARWGLETHRHHYARGYDRKLKKQIPGWFAENEVEVMQWPSQSPDLNPIEHLWAEVERKLGARSFKRPQELWEAIQNVWNEIPIDSLINLVDSMPRRCQAVLNAKGYATKY
jgi:hypothetical protein